MCFQNGEHENGVHGLYMESGKCQEVPARSCRSSLHRIERMESLVNCMEQFGATVIHVHVLHKVKIIQSIVHQQEIHHPQLVQVLLLLRRYTHTHAHT